MCTEIVSRYHLRVFRISQTYEEEGGQKNQRDTGDVDSDIDLNLVVRISMLCERIIKILRGCDGKNRTLVMVSESTLLEPVDGITYEEKLLFEVERHDVVAMRRAV